LKKWGMGLRKFFPRAFGSQVSFSICFPNFYENRGNPEFSNRKEGLVFFVVPFFENFQHEIFLHFSITKQSLLIKKSVEKQLAGNPTLREIAHPLIADSPRLRNQPHEKPPGF